MTGPTDRKTLRFIEVSDRALFDAFANGDKPTGIYAQDAMRWAEFQRGWNAALNYVNQHALQRDGTDGEA